MRGILILARSMQELDEAIGEDRAVAQILNFVEQHAEEQQGSDVGRKKVHEFSREFEQYRTCEKGDKSSE